MKLVVCLFLMLISAKECDKKKAQMAHESQAGANIEMTERRIQEGTKVKYQAISRGYYLDITLEGNRIVISNSRDTKSAKSYELSSEDSRELIHLMSNIDETNLPKLEAPSKAHQYDGAAIATLEIISDDNSYKTVAFDHGNPPETIQALIKKMLSIKDIVEKQ